MIVIWFASAAKRDADRAQAVLNKLEDAVTGWHDKIMNSRALILESNPQVVSSKIKQERVGITREVAEAFRILLMKLLRNKIQQAKTPTNSES